MPRMRPSAGDVVRGRLQLVVDEAQSTFNHGGAEGLIRRAGRRNPGADLRRHPDGPAVLEQHLGGAWRQSEFVRHNRAGEVRVDRPVHQLERNSRCTSVQRTGQRGVTGEQRIVDAGPGRCRDSRRRRRCGQTVVDQAGRHQVDPQVVEANLSYHLREQRKQPERSSPDSGPVCAQRIVRRDQGHRQGNSEFQGDTAHRFEIRRAVSPWDRIPA